MEKKIICQKCAREVSAYVSKKGGGSLYLAYAHKLPNAETICSGSSLQGKILPDFRTIS